MSSKRNRDTRLRRWVRGDSRWAPGRRGIFGRFACGAAAALALGGCDGDSAREIRIAGSSTVYPFTTAVAEAFVNQGGGRKAPVVESIGTGAGLKRFCDGVGWEYPDIANASRRIKASEYALCRRNGAGDILEVQIGVDGVALAEANNGPKLRLTKQDVFLALAAEPRGRANPARTWAQVNPALPAIPIQVMGPPATSGTRDALVELVVEPGCLLADPAAAALKATDTAAYERRCKRIRDDGAYIDKGENDNLIVQGLTTNPNAIGVFGYSYLEENLDRLHGVALDGVSPSYASIAEGRYPGARPLYLYVKKRHLRAVPGLADFLALYATMWNPGGRLAERGLIAAPAAVRARAAAVVATRRSLDPAGLK
jgi:phosphate transport system substrate-binding protein